MTKNTDSEKGKNRGGRPAVVFDEAQTAQVEALGAVLSQGQVADYFGIAENTLSAVFERQPEVFAAYKKGKSKAIALAGGNLLKLVRDLNLGAICFYLKTQGGYRETNKLQFEDPDGVMKPTVIEIVPRRPDGDN